MKKLFHGVCVPKAVGVGECTASTGGRKQDEKYDIAESIRDHAFSLDSREDCLQWIIQKTILDCDHGFVSSSDRACSAFPSTVFLSMFNNLNSEIEAKLAEYAALLSNNDSAQRLQVMLQKMERRLELNIQNICTRSPPRRTRSSSN